MRLKHLVKNFQDSCLDTVKKRSGDGKTVSNEKLRELENRLNRHRKKTRNWLIKLNGNTT